jgi:hypothetical protein
LQNDTDFETILDRVVVACLAILRGYADGINIAGHFALQGI